MKRFMIALTLTVALIASISCSGPPTFESIMSQNLAKTTQMNNVLDTVTDKASAERAVPRLRRLAEEMAGVARQFTEIPEPSIEDVQRVSAKYDQRFQQEQERFANHMVRIAQIPEVSDVINPEMIREWMFQGFRRP